MQAYAQMPVVGALNSIVVKNAEAFSTVVNMGVHESVAATLIVGDVASEGITFRCVACDSNGANPTATITGKTIAVTAHASNNDSTQYVINLSAAQLAAAQPTKQYVKFGVVTDNVVGGPMSIVVQSAGSRYGAGSSADAATVITVV